MFYFFFFNDTATTEIYTLSLHDALPIYAEPQRQDLRQSAQGGRDPREGLRRAARASRRRARSEEHTSELQSPCNLVCRLLLEKKKHPTGRPARQVRRRARSRQPETRERT